MIRALRPDLIAGLTVAMVAWRAARFLEAVHV
jgi:hypothetical protein